MPMGAKKNGVHLTWPDHDTNKTKTRDTNLALFRGWLQTSGWWWPCELHLACCSSSAEAWQGSSRLLNCLPSSSGFLPLRLRHPNPPPLRSACPAHLHRLPAPGAAPQTQRGSRSCAALWRALQRFLQIPHGWQETGSHHRLHGPGSRWCCWQGAWFPGMYSCCCCAGWDLCAWWSCHSAGRLQCGCHRTRCARPDHCGPSPAHSTHMTLASLGSRASATVKTSWSEQAVFVAGDWPVVLIYWHSHQQLNYWCIQCPTTQFSSVRQSHKFIIVKKKKKKKKKWQKNKCCQFDNSCHNYISTTFRENN